MTEAVARTVSAGHFLHWGVIQISVANLIVIGLMLLVFALAVLIPFGGGRKAGGRRRR